MSRVSEAGKFTIRWVLRHSYIKGDERADALTKIASKTQTKHTQVSAARARYLIDERFETGITAYWHKP